VNKILRAEYNHEKEYIVQVNKPLNTHMLIGMSSGVPLFEGTIITNKCSVVQLTPTTFKIILTQGLNRQIRRMCQYFNYEVVSLERIRIMNVKLDSLPVGEYRDLTTGEVALLNR
jgi:23S rRNA pseudouridine2604 synthase